jgi:hypothetical protein
VSFKNIWIGDSGASCHCCNNEEGLFDQAGISEMITVGNGSTMKTENFVKLRNCVLQCYGRKFEITVENVKFVPGLLINLFRINKAQIKGFMIGNEGLMIKLTKGGTTLVFDQRLITKEGFMSGIKMVPDLNQVANIVVETKILIKTMSVEINNLHKIIGQNVEKLCSMLRGQSQFMIYFRLFL